MRLSAFERAVRLGILVMALGAFVLGISGGLVRLGVVRALLNTDAVLVHGALMISGFLGTVIALERAVALRSGFALLAPLACGAGAVLSLCGRLPAGASLYVVGAGMLVLLNALIVKKQPAAHSAILLIASAALVVGNALALVDMAIDVVLPWWFAFLILTIAGERLEMTRLMKRRPAAQPMLFAIVLGLLGAAALASADLRAGTAVYGLALVTLAVWLLNFDIARRTIRSPGLPGYTAACLLAGYGWLAVAGGAWFADAVLGAGLRDLAVHALALGFVMSMILGHAPIVLPAIMRVKLRFGAYFYLPFTALHGSLLLRFFGVVLRYRDLQIAGGLLNTLSLALFFATMAYAAARGHMAADRHPA